jgi:hypothetical protein
VFPAFAVLTPTFLATIGDSPGSVPFGKTYAQWSVLWWQWFLPLTNAQFSACTTPGRGNRVYFPPALAPTALSDPGLRVMITEGEFKANALWRLAKR